MIRLNQKTVSPRSITRTQDNHLPSPRANPEEIGFFPLLEAMLIIMGSLQFLAILFSLVGIVINLGTSIFIIILAILAGWKYWAGRSCRQYNQLHPPGRWLSCILLISFLLYGFLWILAYALPELSYDGLWYHNPAMHFWALKGKIHWITVDPSPFWGPHINNCLNGFPKGVETLGYILIQATGLHRLINALNLPFLPLGILAIAALCRFFGSGKQLSLTAGLLFLFIPVNIAQGPTSYVDSATAACYISFFAMLAHTLNQIQKDSLHWRLSIPLGCSLGLSLGAKTPAIILLPAAVLILSIFWFRNHRHKSSGKAAREPIPDNRRRNIFRGSRFILITTIIAIAVGGYWSIRNYYYTKNPINPVGISVAGIDIFPNFAWDTQFHPPYAPGTENWSQPHRVLFNWLEGIRNWRWAKTTYGSLSGGLGLLWLLGCVPAIVFTVILAITTWFRKHSKCPPVNILHPDIFLILLILGALLFETMPRHHNHIARYTIWLYGIGLPCLAFWTGKTWNYSRISFKVIGRLWIIFICSIFVWEGLFTLQDKYKLIHLRRDEDINNYPKLSMLGKSLVKNYPSGYQEGSLMDTLLKGQNSVALGPLHDRKKLILGRLLQGRGFGQRNIYFLDPQIAKDKNRLFEYIKQRNLRFIVWDDETTIPRALKNLSLLQEFSPGGFYVLAYNLALSETYE